MPDIIPNPWRGVGLGLDVKRPSDDVSSVRALLQNCPAHAPTPLVDAPRIAEKLGVQTVLIKDERNRMNMGSFKALGAAYVIATEASKAGSETLNTALKGQNFVTASAGNHGLSVAMGARVFGADATIFLAVTVPEAFAERLRELGATVRFEGDDYEASMKAAASYANQSGATLLSDSSWRGYIDLPHLLMEGYLQLGAEAAEAMATPPTHIALQAGVGGFAGAVAAYARHVWGGDPQIIVVEPAAAPALSESIKAGKLVDTVGPVSSMGRLDCKTPSLIALEGLSKDADVFVTLSEEEAQGALPLLADIGLETTPSGAAGIAALLAGFPLPSKSIVWAILTEGPENV
ncbi:MAG: pyridoxal-phosphate dependent enzyme [Pseudomonadota bacterium]